VRVLLTGHLGYVGPVVAQALMVAGHDVTGLDSGFFFEPDGQCLTAADRCGRFPVSDVRDVTAESLKGIEAIVHLAGLSNDPMGELDPDLTLAINRTATLDLARCARAAGVERFIFASSCSLYGAAGDTDRMIDEEAPLHPVSAYAVSKAECERELAALASLDFAPVFLRFATAFGISPLMRFDLVLNNLVAWARTTGEIRVLSDGSPWRPLVHVSDMAHAILCALSTPAEIVRARAFNIGRDDNNLTVTEIAGIVAAQIPGSRIVITGETGGDPRSYRVSFARARSDLVGFAPRWTVADGAAEIDRWIVGEGLTLNDVMSPRFVRLAQLKQHLASGRLDSALRPVGI
jgi:nucleoside-diphosphate-sugar epimerase